MRRAIFIMAWLITPLCYGQTLNIDAYLEKVRTNNINLRISSNTLLQAKQDKQMAKAALLPSAGASASYKRDFNQTYMYLGNTGGMFPDKFPVNFKNNIDANLAVEQMIYNASSITSYKIAKLAEEYSLSEHNNVSQELVKQATQLFFQTLLAKENIKVMKENSDLAKEHWNQIQKLNGQGYASNLQLQQSEIYYKQTIPQHKEAKDLYNHLLNELKVLANIDIASDIDIEGDIEPVTKEFVIDKTDTVLNNNSELIALKNRIRLSELQIKEKQMTLYPDVKLQLGYGFNGASDNFRFKNNNNLTFGKVTLSIPISTGGYRRAAIKKARIDFSNSQLQLSQKQNQLAKDLSNAKRKLNTALLNIDSQKELIELAKKELNISDKKVKLGIITNVELKEIRISLIKAKLNMLNACLDYRIAKIIIARIEGK